MHFGNSALSIQFIMLIIHLFNFGQQKRRQRNKLLLGRNLKNFQMLTLTKKMIFFWPLNFCRVRRRRLRLCLHCHRRLVIMSPSTWQRPLTSSSPPQSSKATLLKISSKLELRTIIYLIPKVFFKKSELYWRESRRLPSCSVTSLSSPLNTKILVHMIRFHLWLILKQSFELEVTEW